MEDARSIIKKLRLESHPEGGHFRETFRDPDPGGGRAASTAIYYLQLGGWVAINGAIRGGTTLRQEWACIRRLFTASRAN